MTRSFKILKKSHKRGATGAVTTCTVHRTGNIELPGCFFPSMVLLSCCPLLHHLSLLEKVWFSDLWGLVASICRLLYISVKHLKSAVQWAWRVFKQSKCWAAVLLGKNTSYSFSHGNPLTEFENPTCGDLIFLFYNFKFYHIVVYTKLSARLSQTIPPHHQNPLKCCLWGQMSHISRLLKTTPNRLYSACSNQTNAKNCTAQVWENLSASLSANYKGQRQAGLKKSRQEGADGKWCRLGIVC